MVVVGHVLVMPHIFVDQEAETGQEVGLTINFKDHPLMAHFLQ